MKPAPAIGGSSPTGEFDRNGAFLKEIGKGYYGFEFAHSVRVDKDDNIWIVDEGTNLVKVQSRRPRHDGARPPTAGGGQARGVSVGPKPPAAGNVAGRRTSARDSAGEHLRLGWLLQQPRREVRQERPLRHAGRQREGRDGTGEFSPPHGIAVDERGNVYVADRTNNRYQVLDNNLEPIRTSPTSGVVGRSASRRVRTSIVFHSNSNPNGNTPGSWEMTGEIYKMELDGTFSGSSGRRAKSRPGSRWCT